MDGTASRASVPFLESLKARPRKEIMMALEDDQNPVVVDEAPEPQSAPASEPEETVAASADPEGSAAHLPDLPLPAGVELR